MPDNHIRHIIIVGGGTAGWMTAAAFAKVLTTQHTAITLIESDEIGTVGVGESTVPYIKEFNELLGLDEKDFMRQTKSTFKLGIEFVNWGKIGDAYFHPFGSFGLKELRNVPFHAYWLKSQGKKEALPFTAYSLEGIAAKAGKFRKGEKIPNESEWGEIGYAFQFDAGLYAQYLREYAEARGVIRQEGKVVDVRVQGENGFIDTLILENGKQIQGDFFIDCSGFRGLLIEKTLNAGYIDWTHWLPCDRAIVVPCEGKTLPPYTRAIAQSAGWQWRIPTQDRHGNGYVYSSHFIKDEEACETLLSHLEGPILAEPRILPFVTGRRKKFWIKNCVAIGLSAGFMEPLEATSIYLIQRGIFALLTLFPDCHFESIDIDYYNHLVSGEYESIRDFLILHYHATERQDTPFWDYCRTMSVPDSLTEKIRLFESYGRIFRDKRDELFGVLSWSAILIGQRRHVRHYDPLVDMTEEDAIHQRLHVLQSMIQDAVAVMPSHRDFLQTYCQLETKVQVNSEEK